MNETLLTDTATAAAGQMIRQAIERWDAQNVGISAFFAKYPDEAYLRPITAGRNRPIYLLGHLTAVSDAVRVLVGVGDLLYPQLAAPFLSSPDGAVADLQPITELRQQWETVTASLREAFAAMPPLAWLERHSNASEEDFATNPSRNKLAILLTRTTHHSYHLGQLNLLVL